MKEGLDSGLIQVLSLAPEYPNQLPFTPTHERKWVIAKGRPWPGKTMSNGIYYYVVLPYPLLEIRLPENPRPLSQMHHSELANGKDVISAGILKVLGGTVFYISNESGHYMPDADSVYYAKTAFQMRQIPLAKELVEDTRWAHFR